MRKLGVVLCVVKEFRGVKIAITGVVTEDVPVSTHPKNVAKPVTVGNTIIVQAWEYGRALGVLDLTLKNGKIIRFEGYLEEIEPIRGKEDQKVLTLVERYRDRMEAVLNEEAGEIDVDLDGERRNVRTRETNLGNLIADIMRHLSKADIAIMNGGGIRASVQKGKIRVKDVYTALPFDNYIVAIKLNGKEIREALEHGVSAVEEEEGRFPQVSALTFKYSLSGKLGSRVKEILVEGKPIDFDRSFRFSTDLLFRSGGCYPGNAFFTQWLPIGFPNSFLPLTYSDPPLPLAGRGRSLPFSDLSPILITLQG